VEVRSKICAGIFGGVRHENPNVMYKMKEKAPGGTTPWKGEKDKDIWARRGLWLKLLI